MKRNVGNLTRQGAIGIERRLYAMGLGRKHNVDKAAVLKVPDEALTRHHEFFGLREVVALGNILLKRTGIDADTNRTTRGTRGINHRVNLRPIADIAGIDAQFGSTSLNSTNSELMVKVNIGNNRHRRLGADSAKTHERGLGRYAHAHDIAARLRQCAHLRKRRLGVGGIGAGHGLNHHRRAAADLHTAHMHRTRQLARQRIGQRQSKHSPTE